MVPGANGAWHRAPALTRESAKAHGVQQTAVTQWTMADPSTTLRARLDSLLWYLLPGICVLCNERSGVAMDLCPYCRGAMPWLEHGCPQCALPLSVWDKPRCDACASRPPPFERTVAPFRYADSIARMIQRVKFGGSRVDARVLGSLLAEQIHAAYHDDEDAEWPDLIVPVPLSLPRLLRRGHNQAALFARWVARDCSLQVDYDLCRRTRHTRAQTGLSRAARLRNLTGAFAVRRPIDGRCIAILDDVMTTGATVTALTRSLLAAGAGAVHVWTIARTMEPQPQRQPAHSATSVVR
jgi:ComF family protein